MTDVSILEDLINQVKAALHVHLRSTPFHTITRRLWIHQIFDRALSEPQFSKMYAQLCHSIREVCPKFERDGKQVNFKQLLLNRCQKEFEKEVQNLLPKSMPTRCPQLTLFQVSANEQALHESKERARMFGNVIFIGELFKLGLLTDKIMHTCIINALLPEQPTEEKLEAFCKLMSTVGKQLDTQAKVRFLMLDLHPYPPPPISSFPSPWTHPRPHTE